MTKKPSLIDVKTVLVNGVPFMLGTRNDKAVLKRVVK